MNQRRTFTNLGGYGIRKEQHHCYFKQYKSPKYAPNLSFFGQIRRCIRTLTTITSYHPNTSLHFRSENQINDERNRHIRGNLWLTIHPYSLFNFYWRTVMCVVYISSVIVYLQIISLTETLQEPVKENCNWTWPHYINLVMNLINVVDIFILFCTGYIRKYKFEHNLLTMNQPVTTIVFVELRRKQIATNYLTSFFFVDSICLFGLAERYFYSYFLDKDRLYYSLIFRLVRYLRLLTAFQQIKLVLTKVFKLWHDEVYKIFTCIFAYFFVIYFFGCMYILVPRLMYVMSYEKADNRFTEQVRKIYKNNDLEASDKIIFIHAMFESVVSIFAGKTYVTRDISKECAWIYTCNIIVGCILTVYIFLVILRILSTSQMSRLKFKTIEDDMHQFLKNYDINDTTLRNMYMFLDNQFRGEYFNEQDILTTLPVQLQYEIFTEVSMGLVRNCDLFYGLPNDLMTSLTIKLKFETHMPGVKVISQGEISTCMFFIASGTVAVYGKNGREICHLGDGSYFGEIGLLEQQTPKRVADVVCIEYCQLYRLDKKDFQEVVKPNSEIGMRIQREAAFRMQQRRPTSLVTSQSSNDFLRNMERRITIKKLNFDILDSDSN